MAERRAPWWRRLWLPKWVLAVGLLICALTAWLHYWWPLVSTVAVMFSFASMSYEVRRDRQEAERRSRRFH